MTDAYSQVMIAVCGICSIWLSNAPDADQRRWAPILGIIAQPFWMWTTWQAGQWGIFALSFVYAAGWARGIHTYWFRRTQ
jgi:hypothetical protein